MTRFGVSGAIVLSLFLTAPTATAVPYASGEPALALVRATAVAAQDERRVYDVQYAVPFGVVSGRIMLLDGYLVFYDDNMPEYSFVVPRAQIAALAVDEQVVTVDVTAPVRDREGLRTQFSFRLAETVSAAPFLAWRGAGPQMVTSGLAASMAATGEQPQRSYTVKHKHRFGSCRGHLIIRGAVIAYDSIDSLDHSRRWEPIDIRELDQGNPYELKIEPFTGNDYNFELQGRGMDPADFKSLADQVTAARTSR